MKAFVLHKAGSASHLKLENLDDPRPKKNEVLIKHSAIGINYFDIHFRSGHYTASNLPAILGMEACGYIEEVGSEVADFKVGDRVAYATGPLGAYAEKRVLDSRFLVLPPKNLTDVQVAGSLLKGLMTHTLLWRVYIAAKSKRILIHAVTGGVGQFLCSWAKEFGLEVIGTVGSDEKIPAAKALGCDHVINYRKADFLKEVENITKAEGVGIVYDGVGKDTIEKSIQCLWPMGVCVSYGEASGKTPPINLDHLLLNSLYITRPTLALYKAKRVELVLSANEVFDRLSNGVLRPNITTYKFSDLPKAHEALESRKTIGSLVVTV